MASLRELRRYGLSCGENNKSRANTTLYHVKLTDTAIRALEAFQNLKGALQSQPKICFKENQGYIKIPAPTPESSSDLRVFAFYLSSDGKDQPQASFDCIHQYVLSDGREQLEGQGSIQDKITVCATDDSYQMTRERMSQVEKDSWSRSAIEIKPGATHPSKCIKYQKRPAPLPVSDGNLQKQQANNRRNGGSNASSQKPLKDRILHLLALKPYRKPELLLWLERERSAPKDKAELGAVLEEVAKVNLKDSSYLLRDDYYKYVQRDWPGYSEEEKQLISKLLARKVQPLVHNQTRSLQTNSLTPKTSEDQSVAKNPAVKRLMASDSLENLEVKRQKLTDPKPQSTVNGALNRKGAHNNASLTPKPSCHARTETQRTSNHRDNRNGPLQSHDCFPLEHKLFGPCNEPVTESRGQEPQMNCLQVPQLDLDFIQQQLSSTSSQHKKKKSKKHKDKQRERFKEDKGTERLKMSPTLNKNPDQLQNPDVTKAVDSEEKPDYVPKYGPITSLEQRQKYEEDFCAEYDEYKDLHSRIATITHMFVHLGSKIKSLSPGTQEYKIMEDQILEKYNKFRKKFPGYREEKKHCEYLHEKLSYIKQLIVDYDLSKASLQHSVGC